MARTEDWTVEQVADALRQSGGRRLGASKLLGCSPSTVARFIKRHPELEEVESEAFEEMREKAVDVVRTHIEANDLRAAMFFLMKKGGWTEKHQVDATVTHQGTPTAVIILPAETPLPDVAPEAVEAESGSAD